MTACEMYANCGSLSSAGSYQPQFDRLRNVTQSFDEERDSEIYWLVS